MHNGIFLTLNIHFASISFIYIPNILNKRINQPHKLWQQILLNKHGQCTPVV